MEKIIYTTSSCDAHSFNQLKVFLYTLDHFGNDIPLVIDLINGSEAEEKALHCLNPDIVEINQIKIPYTDEVVKRKTEEIPLYNVKVMYTRPLGLMRVLNSAPDAMVLSIDTDIIIRGPINGVFDNVVPGSIKVWDKGPKKKDRVRFQAGVMVYGNSKSTRKYYQDVLDIIGDIRDFETGQAALYQAYLKNAGCIKKIDMPKKFNDSHFTDDSLIWHCKHGHFANEYYQKEYQFALDLLNGVLYEAFVLKRSSADRSGFPRD